MLRLLSLILFSILLVKSLAGQHHCHVFGQAQSVSDKPVSYTRSSINLPVVVHVVYFEQEENLPEALIFSQIQQLNDDFNGRNQDLNEVPPVFRRFIGNPGFTFCLAVRDPDGRPSNGIVRVNADKPNIGGLRSFDGTRSVKQTNLGGSDPWDTRKYINIWIANREDGILGDATFPLANDSNEPQGIVIRYDAIGPGSLNPRFELGRTLTHEMAHYFNVLHLWGNDASCNSDDDGVKDTPQQGEIYTGCERGEFISCGTKDMDTNFLNFRDDDCLHYFTKGQSDRMIDALFRFRYDLLVGRVCGVNMVFPPDPLAVATILHAPGTTFISLRTLETQEYHLRLYDLTGRFIWSEHSNIDHVYRIDHSAISNGIYILSLEWNGQQFARKLLLVAD